MTYKRTYYSDLGYSPTEMALPYCGNLPATSVEMCRSMPNADGVGFNANRGAAAGGGALSSIGQGIGSIFGTWLGTRGQPPPGTYPPGYMPPAEFPLMPVLVIGGIGLVAFMALRRPSRSSSAPATNPFRRRRRRRSRSRRRRTHRRR
jgi:hypothetical protein